MARAKRIDISNALGEKKKEWHCVMFPEQFHAWSVKKNWDNKPFTDAKISLTAVEVKSSKTTSKAHSDVFDRKTPLILDSGLEILDGRSGLTPQNRTARFYLRVDGITEFNHAMKELSKKFDFQIWEVSKVEIYNSLAGATLFFEVHSPNGVETRLYFRGAKTPDYEKSYESISIYDQQRLCNNFYEYFASCHLEPETVMKKACALEKRKHLKKIK